MTTDLFREQSRRLLEAEAADLGCGVEALHSHALTVVARPEPQLHRRGRVALVSDSGLGTVVSVVPQLVDWVRENAPRDHHFRATQPFFLAAVAQRARELGFAGARAHGLHLGFALSELRATPPLPKGYELREVEREWMERYRPLNVFDNAIGEDGETDRIENMLTGFAVFGPDGEPAAVAGVGDEGHGCEEIGVDVRRESRGLGLAGVVTIAATAYIIARGRIAYYACGATNVRSHHNAIACGFLPLFTHGMVYTPRL